MRAVPLSLAPRARKVSVLCAATLLNFCALAFLYTYTVLIAPIAETFSLSRSAAALPQILFWGALAVMAPFVGAFLDRVNVRAAILIGTGVAGLTFCMLSLAPTFEVFVALVVVLGATALFVGTQAVNRLIVNWFDRSRGAAFGITSTGYALAGMTLPLAATYGIQSVGWRTTVLIFGLAILIVLVPMVFLLVAGKPEDVGLAADCVVKNEPAAATESHGTGNATPPLSWGVVATPGFWWVTLIIGLQAGIGLAVMTHAAPAIRDQSIDALQAATVVSVLHAGVFLGNPSWGWLADRFGLRSTVLFAVTVQAVGVGGFALSQELPAFLGFGFLFGLGYGAIGALHGLIVSRVFDHRAFGRIFGLTFIAELPIRSAIVFLPGWLRDETGSYSIGLGLLLAGYLANAVLVLSWRRFGSHSHDASVQHSDARVAPVDTGHRPVAVSGKVES